VDEGGEVVDGDTTGEVIACADPKIDEESISNSKKWCKIDFLKNGKKKEKKNRTNEKKIELFLTLFSFFFDLYYTHTTNRTDIYICLGVISFHCVTQRKKVY
jgi:hypothetical protein